MRLTEEWYKVDARELAKKLLGKTLVHEVDGKILKGKIVETEAYIGLIDKACHAYGGKRTKRLEPLYAEGGTIYVYLIYGIYKCFNVIASSRDIAEGVLVRAIEPVEEIDTMAINRFGKNYEELTKVQKKNLTSGPGKLCMAMDIGLDFTGQSLQNATIYIEKPSVQEDFGIVEAKRVGIDYAEEAKDFLWRYYIKGNPYVSII